MNQALYAHMNNKRKMKKKEKKINKVTVLAPLQWGHQTLSSCGFPTYPHSSCMYSPLCV
jgi:hypothetical protein